MTTFDDTTANVTTGMAPIEVWRQDKFGADASNPTIAGNGADPDLDGIINLFEYGLNLNPHAPDGMPNMPWTEMNGGDLSLLYRKNLDAADLTYTIQGSPDMVSWNTVNVTSSIVTDDGETRVIRAMPTPRPAGSQYFLRLMINVVVQ